MKKNYPQRSPHFAPDSYTSVKDVEWAWNILSAVRIDQRIFNKYSQINFAISFIFFIFPNPISSVLVPLHSKQTAEHSLHVNQ